MLQCANWFALKAFGCSFHLATSYSRLSMYNIQSMDSFSQCHCDSFHFGKDFVAKWLQRSRQFLSVLGEYKYEERGKHFVEHSLYWRIAQQPGKNVEEFNRFRLTWTKCIFRWRNGLFLWPFRAVYCFRFDAFCCDSFFFRAQLETYTSNRCTDLKEKRDAFALFQVEILKRCNTRATQKQQNGAQRMENGKKRQVKIQAKTKCARGGEYEMKEKFKPNAHAHTQCMRNSFYCFRWTHTTIGLFVSSSWSLFSSVLFFIHFIRKTTYLSYLSETCFSYPIPILTEKSLTERIKVFFYMQ